MHFSNLLTVASLAATAVEAAPRGTGFTRWLARQQSHADREALRYRDQRLEAEARHALHRRAHNETNATAIIRHPVHEDENTVTVLPVDDDGVVTIDCSVPPTVVSTTTVDVTVFVTETPSPVPTDDGEDESTTTTDCEETTPVIVVVPSSTVITEIVTTTSIGDDGTPTTVVVTQSTTEPCDTTITDGSSMSTPGVPTSSESLSTIVLTAPNVASSSSTLSIVTSTPGLSTTDSSSIQTSTSEEMSSPTISVIIPPTTTEAPSSTTDRETDMTTPIPNPGATYEICIDINITPVTTSKLTVTPTSPPEPTRTVCVEDHETGKPEEEAIYCGVKGKPAGVYFIAEFIEERSGVPVTEEGCYQFCDSVMESTDGCQSYRFYHNELGAPRCALYGMPVASSIYDLDENQDDTWYDLACGSPKDEGWTTAVPDKSTKTTPTTLATSPTLVVSEAVSTETSASSEPVTTEIPVVTEPATTETSATNEPSTTSAAPTATSISDDDEVVNEPIDNSGTISDTGNVDSGNFNSGNTDSFNNNDNNDNNNNSGSLIDIDVGGLTG